MSSVLTSGPTDEVALDQQLTGGDGRSALRPVASVWQRISRNLLFDRLRNLETGQLTIDDGEGRHLFHGSQGGTLCGAIEVRDPSLYRRVATGGSLGAAESYMQGDWESEDLTQTLRLLTRNQATLSAVDSWGARFLAPWRSLWMWSRRNTRRGSRRNIAAHYDLSNEFFALMLDPTMTYSSGIFEHPQATLEQASLAKYERICRRLQLCSSDRVLEIGSGWGGFAIYAARNYGCRVTTTTISEAQYRLARERIRAAGLEDRIEILLKDYRDLDGQYDKAVSIEMVEAVGEQMFDTYFGKCGRLLKPTGALLLQAIMMPDDRYDAYRKSVDFINRYVFPGGFLPSFSAIGQSLRRATDFRLVHAEDFAADYARTLAAWRDNFWQHIDRVRSLGFDEQFIRTWHYYLCYCEAGFSERQIGVSQILLTRPQWQVSPSCKG